ncbi:MAG: PDZ domain-containing protein, partial [Acidobacteria bacterium]|nr:PDZ domain-containing protein [Acidobacteriota bacterium]
PNSQRLPPTYGALVVRVVPNSPVATQLRKHDVIIEVNGHPIRDVSDATHEAAGEDAQTDD